MATPRIIFWTTYGINPRKFFLWQEHLKSGSTPSGFLLTSISTKLQGNLRWFSPDPTLQFDLIFCQCSSVTLHDLFPPSRIWSWRDAWILHVCQELQWWRGWREGWVPMCLWTMALTENSYTPNSTPPPSTWRALRLLWSVSNRTRPSLPFGRSLI